MTLTTADVGAQLELLAPVESPVEGNGTIGLQLSLLESPDDLVESPDYYRRQLITYIGNKRQLLDPIAEALKAVQAETGRDRLHLLDGFAGSGIVSRLFKAYAERVASNDLGDC